MIWTTTEIEGGRLAEVLAQIRGAGGTITHCCPASGTCLVTYCSRSGRLIPWK